jgi:predicted DNA-binding transcriptional regulator AlpA
MTRHQLVTTEEVARALGVSIPRVHQLRAEHHDFPEPNAAASGPRRFVFSAAAVKRWATKHNYEWNLEAEK